MNACQARTFPRSPTPRSDPIPEPGAFAPPRGRCDRLRYAGFSLGLRQAGQLDFHSPWRLQYSRALTPSLGTVNFPSGAMPGLRKMR